MRHLVEQIEHADEVGLDVAQKVAGVLSAAFPERMAPTPVLDKLVSAIAGR